MWCSTVLAYLPPEDRILMLPLDSPARPMAQTDGTAGLKPCANRDIIGCNWLCESDAYKFCLSCRHTTRIPDISDEANRARWARLERSKRRLFYAIIKFMLPLESDPERASGFLHFEFLGDGVKLDGTAKRVITGHADGRITINITEADDAIRERTRTEMGEPYRTLLGHFRHEVGHYFWDKLLAGKPEIEDFRACFGDERSDYSAALKAHYRNGPVPGWQISYVSAYAAAHPWEDFAETWAHYFHMVSGLETAYAYGINPQPLRPDEPRLVQLKDPFHEADIQELIDHWVPLTVAMNAMNRSLGNQDYYPFVLTPAILKKLKFVHDLIAANKVASSPAPAMSQSR